MIHKAYLHCLDGRVYELEPDLTISEEFSETLDSATISVPRVRKSDPLVEKLNPYDDVCLQITDENGREEYSSHFLVDSVDVKQVSYTGDPWFSATVSLMSQTKWLEKIQLPNVSMTRSLVGGRKSVKEWLDVLVERYSPELNMEDGYTEPLLSVDETADWSAFEATPCADLSMSRPTLRQALTSLFTQCGALPVVKDRKISYLNLKAPQTAFQTFPCVPAERKSVSSDSWVNSLVTEAAQSVDIDSLCVSERICFRDRENVLLQQKNNLKLETRFPIYKVDRLIMNGYVSGNLNVHGYAGIHGVDSGSSIAGGATFELVEANGYTCLKITPVVGSGRNSHVDGEFTFKASLMRPKADGNGFMERFSQDGLSLDLSWNVGSTGVAGNTIIAKLYQTSQYSPDGNDFVVVSGNYTGTAGSGGVDDRELSDYPIIVAEKNMTKSGVGLETTYSISDDRQVSFLSSLDITPLCMEASKRAQLDVDFLSMPAWSTPEGMAKWVYATVGYEIGGSEITGFSQTYDRSHGWWNGTYTYIENIVNSVSFGYGPLQEYYGGAFDGCDPKKAFDKTALLNPFFKESQNNFSLLFFDLDYVPLSKFKGAFEKDDVALPLRQLDAVDNALSDLVSLATAEGEKADRMGNPVWSLHTRVDEFQQAQELNSAWGDKVVFKRTLKVGFNAIDCEYVLAKDYILRNYFTALSTKYRAYEYVDYSSSIERNELGNVYLRLSSSGHGPKANRSTAISLNIGNSVLPLIDCLLGKKAHSEGKRLVGAGFVDRETESVGFQLSRSEVSAMCAGPSMYLTMSEYDNQSDGPYVDGTYLDPNGEYASDPLGGIPQRWYESRQEWGRVWFFSPIKPLSDREIALDEPLAHIESAVKATQLYPRYKASTAVSPTEKDFEYGFNFDFNLVGKDLSERLALTLQITACWATGERFEDKSKVRFSKWLYRLSSACGGNPLDLVLCKPRPWTEAEYEYDPAKKIANVDYLLKVSKDDGKTAEFDVNPAASALSEPFDLVSAYGSKAKTIAHFEAGALGEKVYLDVCRAKSDRLFSVEGDKGVLYENEIKA